MDSHRQFALMLLLLAAVALSPRGAVSFPDSLVVGWSDEFNNPADWQSFPAPNAPDMSAPRKGVVRLKIGKRAVDGSIPFNWASAWRIAEVDLKRYPILAVSVHDLRGPGWWDVTVQRWEKKEGLPVYRHQHDKLGSVFAYQTELAAWTQVCRVILNLHETVTRY